ncbi:Metalloprotease [Amanita rubescens]|nr:Metalloprotease [Amanita rubescens]
MYFSLTLALAFASSFALAAPSPADKADSSVDLCMTHASSEDLEKVEAALRNVTTTDADESEEKSRIFAPIPVYFHVIAAGRTPQLGWVSDVQIRAQIAVINQDYAPFGFSWRLAGVDRTINADWFNNEYYNTPQERSMKRSLRLGGANALNVYSVGFTSHPGLLGYATFPWAYLGDRVNDGVVLYFKSLPGGGLPTYSLGPPGDGVADTPAEASPAYGCPVRRDTCPGAGQDPFHNYMDYTNDACQNQFTRGQAQRFTALASLYRGIR